MKDYNDKIKKHLKNPNGVGSLDNIKDDKNVGTGIVGSPSCGDVFKLQFQVNEEGIVTDVVQKTFGCGTAQASGSFVINLIKGKHLDEVAKITDEYISSQLDLPKIKFHCSVLAEAAIKEALKDYYNKQTNKK